MEGIPLQTKDAANKCDETGQRRLFHKGQGYPLVRQQSKQGLLRTGWGALTEGVKGIG